MLIKKIEILLIITILFAVHPMNTEAVDWISARSTLLFSFFYLLALIFWLKSPPLTPPERRGNLNFLSFGKVRIGISLFFFLLSCLSKSMAVTLPLILILIDYYKGNYQLSIINYQFFKKYLPFFVLSIIFGLVATNTKSMIAATNFSFFDRIFLASYGVIFYLFKLFVPINLCVSHLYPSKQNGLFPLIYYLAPLIIWH